MSEKIDLESHSAPSIQQIEIWMGTVQSGASLAGDQITALPEPPDLYRVSRTVVR